MVIFCSISVSFAQEADTPPLDELDNNPIYDNITNLLGNEDENGEPTKLLTLNESLLLALERNPELEMSLERVNQAGFAAEESKAKLYPTLDFRGLNGYRYMKPFPGSAEGDSDAVNEGSIMVQLRQLLFDGFSSTEEAKRRTQIKSSSEIEAEIVKENTVTEAIDYYFTILRYQQAREEAGKFILEMQIIMDKINIMQQSGAASMIELDFAKARLASAKSEASKAATSYNDAVANLEFLVEDLPPFHVEAPFRLGEFALMDLEHYIELSKINNSQIRLHESKKQSQRHRIKVEKGKRYPVVNVIVERKRARNESGNMGYKTDSSIMLQANYRLFDGGKRRAAISKAKSKYRELSINDRLVLRELEKEVKLAYNQVKSIRNTIATTDEEILANERLQQLNHQNLALGEVKIIELIEVEERLFRSRTEKHKQVTDLFINYYDLMIKSGQMKTAILGAANAAP